MSRKIESSIITSIKDYDKLTLVELSMRTGITKQTISKILSNLGKLPHIKNTSIRARRDDDSILECLKLIPEYKEIDTGRLAMILRCTKEKVIKLAIENGIELKETPIKIRTKEKIEPCHCGKCGKFQSWDCRSLELSGRLPLKDSTQSMQYMEIKIRI